MPYKDKEQQRSAQAAHYRDNVQKYTQRAAEWKTSRREQMRMFARKLKESTPCSDCGVKYPFYIMDFDHRDSDEKSACIADMCHQTAPQVVFEAEIAKCDIVCSNCHRERTFGNPL